MESFQIISYVGFSKDQKPYWSINNRSEVSRQSLDYNKEISLEFDTNRRHCIGWHDLETSEDNICDEDPIIDLKYHQCQKCQAKAGFNPAFYNADSVSEVQQKRNSKPHYVYLAYFANGFTKVGISYQGRGYARLLEQGAKAAIVLDTFNSALVARGYEADISKLDNFVENVKTSKKIDILKEKFDPEEAKKSLYAALENVEQKLGHKFENQKFLNLFDYYFASDFDKEKLKNVIDVSEQNKITGKIIGLYGSILLCQYQEDVLALPVKKFVGFNFKKQDETTEIDLPTQQFSLF